MSALLGVGVPVECVNLTPYLMPVLYPPVVDGLVEPLGNQMRELLAFASKKFPPTYSFSTVRTHVTYFQVKLPLFSNISVD